MECCRSRVVGGGRAHEVRRSTVFSSFNILHALLLGSPLNMQGKKRTVVRHLDGLSHMVPLTDPGGGGAECAQPNLTHFNVFTAS